ncbi:virulence-associated V antigen [Vibrio harveyi]|nr:virulence-associated V antigen [Vibrio harveyi]
MIESSIGDRFDERVLFALNERRVNRLEKRDQQKEELQSYTARLKIFGEVQSQIHIKQSGSGTYGEGYNPESYKFNHTSFNYSTPEEFHKSPEFKHLSEVFRSDKGWGQPGPGKRANIYQDYIDFDAINRDKVNLSKVSSRVEMEQMFDSFLLKRMSRNTSSQNFDIHLVEFSLHPKTY